MFIEYASAYAMLPGGFGALEELAEILALVQTGETQAHPHYPGPQSVLGRDNRMV